MPMSSSVILLSFSFLFCCSQGQSDDSWGPSYSSSYVYLLAKSPKGQVKHCANYQQYVFVHDVPSSESAVSWLPVNFMSDPKGQPTESQCDGTLRQESNSLVPVEYRPNCSEEFPSETGFTQRVEKLYADSGAAALLFTVHKYQDYIYNKSYAGVDVLYSQFRNGYLDTAVRKPVYFIYSADFVDGIAAKLGTEELQMGVYRPAEWPLDPAMAVVLVLASICVGIGGFWSGRVRTSLWRQEQGLQPEDVDSDLGEDGPESGSENEANSDGEGGSNRPNPRRRRKKEEKEPSSAPLSYLSLLLFIVMIVGFLLLLYYLYDYAVWAILLVYALAGTVGIYECVLAFWGATCAFGQLRIGMSIQEAWAAIGGRGSCYGDCSRRHPRWRNIVVFCLAAIFCLTWFFTRKERYAFVLQDTIAVFFSINAIKSFRAHSLRILSLLLGALLVYDLFMVFLTPYITSNGCSIMVEVATGEKLCHKHIPTVKELAQPINRPYMPYFPEREELPILIKVPRLKDPMIVCYQDAPFDFTMLGLGDIILPGLLVGFAFSVDGIQGGCYLYGPVTLIAYIAGLIITFAALLLMQMAQPALIYLVPATLLSLYVTALIRGQFCSLWKAEFAEPRSDTADLSPRSYQSIRETEAQIQDPS